MADSIITDYIKTGLEVVNSNSFLTTLDIGNNLFEQLDIDSMDINQLKLISNELKLNKTLKTLRISNYMYSIENCINDSEPIIELLKVNSSLTTINLCNILINYKIIMKMKKHVI